ncbi:MAG: MBL fold metallo-hydrolase [Acidobacteriota bacterium]|nr:MBL fold metallo-hydrolase [Acidobacteriota bacterium]
MVASARICVLVLFLWSSSVVALSQGTVKLSYMGTAGWEITDGQTVILVDPYLTRLKTGTPNDPPLASDPRSLVTDDDFAISDPKVIDAHISKADYILITHTHMDHVLDVPYIARKTGATVIGTESTSNFARDNGVPDAQILTVCGGDDLQLHGFSVQVIPSLHGILPSSFPSPSTIFPANARPPFRLGQLFVEGGTVAYLIRIAGHQIIVFGSMNYIERELEGLRPDVALIGAMPERHKIYRYTERLLHALGYPPLVMPTHWDRFNVGYDVSQQPAIDRVQSFIAEVKAVSPHTEVKVPKYFVPVAVGPSATPGK